MFDQIPGPAGRPDHPDFWKLSDIILQLDGKTEDPDFDMGELIAKHCDPQSFTYMAMQRAMRLSDDPLAQVMMASMWIDGFFAGHEFRARKLAP